MADRSRHSQGFRRGTFIKRGTFWGRSPADTVSTTLGASSSVLDSTAVPVAEGETIVRTRGWIGVASDQAAVSEAFVGALGFAIASDQAVAVGVGSLPTPYTDQDSELWFVHQFFTSRMDIDSAGLATRRGYDMFSFDSKAMRKMQSGQTLVIVVENGSAVGMQYQLTYAVLFKVA